MATIVEYSAEKPARNRYPQKIISPPFPSPCCLTRMRQVGEPQEENGHPFVYWRCRSCGYTVRRFQAQDPNGQVPRIDLRRRRWRGYPVIPRGLHGPRRGGPRPQAMKGVGVRKAEEAGR